MASLTTEILQDTLERVPGTLLVGIIGTDGIPVEMVSRNDDLPYGEDEANDELSRLTATLAEAVARLGSGRLYDVLLESDDMVYLIARIIPGYYAVLAVEPETNLGEARSAIHDLLEALLDEL